MVEAAGTSDCMTLLMAEHEMIWFLQRSVMLESWPFWQNNDQKSA